MSDHGRMVFLEYHPLDLTLTEIENRVKTQHCQVTSWSVLMMTCWPPVVPSLNLNEWM